MILARAAAACLLCVLSGAATAQEAGLSVILDAQSADIVDQKFCVYDSKLYSPNAELCVGKLRKLTCAPADPNDPAKGLAWSASDDAKRCNPR